MLERTTVLNTVRPIVQAPPTIAMARTLTTKPIASTIAPSTTPAAIFALITRIRFGTSVNVISAVRCDHSEETSRMPMIGSRMLAGRIESANMSRKIRSSVSPKMQNRITIASVKAAVVSCSQKPARVSTILRSSTNVRRGKETAGFMRGSP